MKEQKHHVFIHILEKLNKYMYIPGANFFSIRDHYFPSAMFCKYEYMYINVYVAKKRQLGYDIPQYSRLFPGLISMYQ